MDPLVYEKAVQMMDVSLKQYREKMEPLERKVENGKAELAYNTAQWEKAKLEYQAAVEMDKLLRASAPSAE